MRIDEVIAMEPYKYYISRDRDDQVLYSFETSLVLFNRTRKLLADNGWALNFGNYPSRGAPTTNQPFKYWSTIESIVNDFCNNRKPTYIIWTAANKSLAKLYTRIQVPNYTTLASSYTSGASGALLRNDAKGLKKKISYQLNKMQAKTEFNLREI